MPLSRCEKYRLEVAAVEIGVIDASAEHLVDRRLQCLHAVIVKVRRGSRDIEERRRLEGAAIPFDLGDPEAALPRFLVLRSDAHVVVLQVGEEDAGVAVRAGSFAVE